MAKEGTIYVQKMKVLYITNYLGNQGGLGRYSAEVTRAMGKYPVSISVVSEAKTPAESFEYNILKPVFHQKNTWTLLKHFVLNAIAVRKFAKDFDVIHAHDGWPYGVYGFWAVFGRKKKLFITGIGTYTIAPLREKIRGAALRVAYTRAEKIFCISDYVRDRLKALHSKAKAETVFMGVTKLPQLDVDAIDTYKKQFSLNGKKPVILTVGDIKKRKGQFNTLCSLNLLKQSFPNFLYVIIGDDSDVYYMNQIRTYIESEGLENNVLIISHMYDDSVLSFFYGICDVFMLNSNNDQYHFEGFGLVLLEAAQFGKPVIGSRNCGIESALSNCYNGYLAEQGNHQEISQRLLDILREQANVFGENSLEFHSRFSWDNTAQTYYEYYIHEE